MIIFVTSFGQTGANKNAQRLEFAEKLSASEKRRTEGRVDA